MKCVALDIAKYAISKCSQDRCPISNLQLQKILYYIQLEFLKVKNKFLFQDDFEAWKFGPVIPEIYYKFCMNGAMPIFREYDILLNDEITKIIDPVIEEKRELDPWDMVQDTHKSGRAWNLVYKDGRGDKNVMTKELIMAKG